MRVLGIDPGLSITGYGVVEERDQQIGLVEAGVVRTRQTEIASEMESIIAQFRPDAMAIEELYSHYGHPKTAIIMGHARGVVLLKAAEAGVEVFAYASTRIKKSLTGNGRASKEQVQKMVRSDFNLSEAPEPSDAADALAAALCHCRSRQQKQAVTL